MWSVVRAFSTVGEAESARSALDAASIESRIDDENTIAVDWLYSNALGGVKVLVPTERRDEAIEILSTAAEPSCDVEAGEDAVLEPEQADVAPSTIGSRCPACRSADVERVPRLKLLGTIALVAYGVGAAVGQAALALAAVIAVALIIATMPSHRCPACGERWSAEEPVDIDPEAPLPNPADTLEVRCPRCGSPELHHVPYRRLRALPLLASPAAVLIVPLWLVLPKWKCGSCGLRRWLRPRAGEP